MIKFQDNKEWSGVKPKLRPLKGTYVCLLGNCFAEGRKMFVSVSYLWSTLTIRPSFSSGAWEWRAFQYRGTEPLTMTPWHPLDYQNYLGSIGQHIQARKIMLKSTEIFQLPLLLPQMKFSRHMTHTLTTKQHFSHYSVHWGSIQNLNSQVFQDSTYMKNFLKLCFVVL